MKNLKGVGPFISYIFAILMAAVVVISITLLVFTFYTNILRDEVRQELTQVASQVSGEMTKLYEFSRSSKSLPQNETSLLLGDVDLNLPDKVANRNYEIFLVTANQLTTLVSEVTLSELNASIIKNPQAAKVLAKTTEDPIVEVVKDLPNIDVTVQGKFSGGRGENKLRYYRYNVNATVYDAIVIGDAGILVSILVAS